MSKEYQSLKDRIDYLIIELTKVRKLIDKGGSIMKGKDIDIIKITKQADVVSKSIDKMKGKGNTNKLSTYIDNEDSPEQIKKRIKSIKAKAIQNGDW